MNNPNCWACVYVGQNPGSTHARCNHPDVVKANNPLGEAMGILASVGRVPPVLGSTARDFGIVRNFHGVKKGWCNWPYNFDPIWIDNCNAFEQEGSE